MAAKDLQLVRTRPIRVDELPGVANTSDRAGTPDSMGIVVGFMRRQWALLIVAGVASGTIAWFVSLEFSTRTYTTALELQVQQLPVINHNIYETPNADVASEWLMSEAVLQPVVEKYGLPPVPYFSLQLSVNPNVRSGSIRVILEHIEKDAAKSILTDIGNAFSEHISHRRQQVLTKHAEQISSLRLNADRDLSLARSEFIKLKASEQLTVDDFRQNAELQGLVDRRIQAETAMVQSTRNRGRILRNQSVVRQQVTAVRSAVLRDVLTGRQRQAESIGQGLTKSSRLAAVKVKIQQQLASLEAELDNLLPRAEADFKTEERPLPDSAAVAQNSTPVASGIVQPMDGSGAEIQIIGKAEVSRVTDANTVVSVPIQDLAGDTLITSWIEKISDVGKETLGDLDSQTLTAIQKAKDSLATLSNEARKLQFDLDDNTEELAYFQAKERELENAMDSHTTSAASPLSERAMELEARLAFKESRYAELSRQLDQVNQIVDYRSPEYVAQRSADFVVDGENSNWKKLFALAFLGSGILLLIPSAIIELLRLRPAPITVVSRKWKLPVLGVQSPRPGSRTTKRALSADLQNEFRLMALRIQQSLFRPKGRVVLFSGLDHEESPMVLIRSLATCFSQREESVLIIQTLPTPSESSSAKSARAGVAEFLAGELDDASELVIGTGIAGIGFLPGGRATGASEAMASSRLTSLIDEFREHYSMIMLCGPSTLHPADLQMLAARADGIVFTVNKQSLRNIYGDEVIGDLIELGGSILGFAEQPNTSRKAFPADPFQADKEMSGEDSRLRVVSV